MSDLELIKRVNDLQRQVDNLIKPEVPLGMSLISETVVSIAVASVTFSSIPQGFRHLVLFTRGRTDAAVEIDSIVMRFNGDSGANYDFEQFYGNGATVVASAGRATSTMVVQFIEGASSRANLFAAGISFILGYSVSGVEKTAINLGQAFGNLSADADLYAVFRSGLWRNTSVITSVALIPGSGNFVSGSRFQLYGVM